MRKLTESLLTLARFDSLAADGGESMSREKVDLAEVARAVATRLEPLAASRSVHLITDLAPACVASNRDRIAQVVTNLIANAIDYNHALGEVRISTSTSVDRAILIVADTGIGIAPEDLPRVFDRFYRVDKSRSRAAGHTGLGLAICEAIVKGEAGTIEVESTANIGTTFTVRLKKYH